MNAKISLFFEDGAYGWSESFYLTSVGDLATAVTQGYVLASKRCKMLGSGPVCTYIRATEDPSTRSSIVVNGVSPISAPGVRPYYTTDYGLNNNSDLPYSVTLLRIEGGAAHRKQLYLSGVADEDQLDPTGNYSPAFMVYYRAWKAELVANWNFKVINKDPGINPVTNIFSWTPGNPVHLAFGGAGVNDGDSVIIRGVKTLDPTQARLLNGKFTVGQVSAGVWQLNGLAVSAFTIIKAGTIQRQTSTYVRITDVQIERETHRKRGRPFGSPVGRARSRR